jgi:hypothetical protein
MRRRSPSGTVSLLAHSAASRELPCLTHCAEFVCIAFSKTYLESALNGGFATAFTSGTFATQSGCACRLAPAAATFRFLGS